MDHELNKEGSNTSYAFLIDVEWGVCVCGVWGTSKLNGFADRLSVTLSINQFRHFCVFHHHIPSINPVVLISGFMI